MKYPLIFIVKSLPPNTGGMAIGPVVLLLEKYKNDTGLIEHEMTHVYQWCAALALGLFMAGALVTVPAYASYWPALLAAPSVLHGLAYKFVWRYRLAMEVQAYRVQLGYYLDDRKPLFAGFIVSRYDLPVTQQYVLELLK